MMESETPAIVNYRKGEPLGASGSKEATTLIDRSLSARTGLELNLLQPGQDSVPERHDGREQALFVTAGRGSVRVGDETFAVEPQDLVFVPAGMICQTCADASEALEILVFSAYLNAANQEPHSTTGLKAKHIDDIFGAKVYEFGSNTTHLLLDRVETEHCEATVVSWPAGSQGALVAHKDKEQTFFVLSGSGEVTVGNATRPVSVGDVVFVTCNTPHTTKAGQEPLVYLCFNGIVAEKRDSSFQEMYDRVIADRMARWKRGDMQVGE